MRLLTDVNVKAAYISALRGDGHEINRVVDVLHETASDRAIVEHARETGAIILTNDAKDFAQFEDHPGVIVVPQSGLTAGEVAAAISRIDRLVPDTTGLALYVSEWA